MRGRKKKEKGMLQSLKSRKRKKFGTVFLQRWLIVMLVASLLYGEGVVIFTAYQKWKCSQDFIHASSHQSEQSLFLSTDYTEEEISNYLSYQLTADVQRYNTFSYIYDLVTMETIAGCDEKLFLVTSKNDEDRLKFLTCETGRIEGWDDYRRQIAEEYKPFRSVMELLDCYFVYSNGIEFIPIDLKSVVYVKDFLSTKYNSIEDTPSLTLHNMKNIPEGYEYENVGANFINLISVQGYSSASPMSLKNKSHEDGYKLLTKLFADLRYTREPSFELYEESFWGLQIGQVTTLAFSDGRPIMLIMATALNVWKNYGGVLVAIGLCTIAVGTLLALLLAKLSYTRLKAAYALEDYRKNLTNTMAHDLKSPLMSISGYAENLRDNLNTEKQTYYSQSILNGVQYMNGIIESVLYLSKMEEGKLSLKKEPIQVREMVEKLVAEREENLQERGLKAEMAGDVVLEADATLLEQLLCNLLDNAVKYASKNTTICVMMKDKEISIQNVCEEDLSSVEDTLCQPFVVGDTSRSNRKGSGLGLAIARNICELHEFGFELICKEKSFEAKIKG